MASFVIAHTTDLTGDDHAAFLHAGALAASSAARLVTLHGNAPPDAVARLPDAAELATRWGRPIAHERVCHECCDDVTDTLLDALHRLGPGLVVTGTHARHGVAALLRSSVGEALARNLDVPTLVVPNRAAGFVDPRSGAIDLRRVVIPAGDQDEARRGLAAARALCTLAGAADVELIVLHVGGDAFTLPADHGPHVVLRCAAGELDEAILGFAHDQRACAIVMSTRGHDGVMDALFGSHTEHVIRRAACPVLVAPAR